MNSTTVTAAKHDPSRRYLCRHVHTDGRRCGSPALRAQNFCYYHNRTRLPNAPLAGRIGIFAMQPIDDRTSIQIALFDILSRLTAGDIDSKLARTVLYGLQIASSNLAFREKQQPTTQPVETVTTEPFCGDLAPIEEIPETRTESSPAATEPTQTPVVSTTPISQPEPSTESPEEDLPIPTIPLAAVDPVPLTLAAVQACAAQFTPVKPALALSCNGALQTISTTEIPHPIRAVAAVFVGSFTQAVSCRVSPVATGLSHNPGVARCAPESRSNPDQGKSNGPDQYLHRKPNHRRLLRLLGSRRARSR